MIFHVGAEIGLQKTKDELDRINREGTQNVLAFARQMQNLKRFVYISTAYVAGQQKGKIMEALKSR